MAAGQVPRTPLGVCDGGPGCVGAKRRGCVTLGMPPPLATDLSLGPVLSACDRCRPRRVVAITDIRRCPISPNLEQQGSSRCSGLLAGKLPADPGRSSTAVADVQRVGSTPEQTPVDAALRRELSPRIAGVVLTVYSDERMS